MGLPRWLSDQELAGDARDVSSTPGSGRSPGGGNGNPVQYSCQKFPTDREAWQATVHGVAKRQDIIRRWSNSKSSEVRQAVTLSWQGMGGQTRYLLLVFK